MKTNDDPVDFVEITSDYEDSAGSQSNGSDFQNEDNLNEVSVESVNADIGNGDETTVRYSRKHFVYRCRFLLISIFVQAIRLNLAKKKLIPVQLARQFMEKKAIFRQIKDVVNQNVTMNLLHLTVLPKM